MKLISILGSTGSIGTQALDIVKNNSDSFKVLGLSTNINIKKLTQQIYIFKPKYVAIADVKSRQEFIENNIMAVEVVSIDELASINVDIVLNAMVGLSGLKPSINVLKNGGTLAMANKEPVVVAGRLLNEIAKQYNGKIIPVDSEHSAIWQCLKAGQRNDVKKIILTASGGPFRNYTTEQLQKVTPEMASKHPVWNMGKKVTVDSSTLMNKGLEVIEAMNLFGVTVNNIEVVVHRESIIHSMVEYKDNTVIACMSYPDMRLPIQLALTYPDRIESDVTSINWANLSKLHFEKPNIDKFKCLSIAIEAVNKGEGSIIALSAFDEVLVSEFLAGNISFLDIPKYLSLALDFVHIPYVESFNEVLRIDCEARKYIYSILNKAGD